MPNPRVIGLTGSIASGKSTLSHWMKRLNIPIFDADHVVHQAYQDPSILQEIRKVLPEGLQASKEVVRACVSRDPSLLLRLEAILHPYVRREAQTFLVHHATMKTRLVVLDVPLLVEAGMDSLCDLVIVIEAPLRLRQTRLSQRQTLSQELASVFHQRQMMDHMRAKNAHYTIVNDGHKRHTLRQLMNILKKLIRESYTHA